MALGTYNDLIAAVKRQAHRNDVDDAQVRDFISQCESVIYANEVDVLRVREMDTRATATAPINSRYLALPDEFLEMRRLRLVEQRNFDLRYQAPNQMNIVPASGRPVYFTVSSQLEFDRVPDSAYPLEMKYYLKAVDLSDYNQTNFVLTNYPNIYLFGALWFLFQWSMEEQRAQYYETKFYGAIQGANKGTKKGAYGPSPSMRIKGRTP